MPHTSTGNILAAVPPPQVVQARLSETRREEALLRRLLELAKRVHGDRDHCRDPGNGEAKS